jgi:hypothetical protein
MSIEVYNSSTCSPSSRLPQYSHNWPTLSPQLDVRNLTCALNVYDSEWTTRSSVQYYCGPDGDSLIAQINLFPPAIVCTAKGSSRNITTLEYVGLATPGVCSDMWLTDWTTSPSRTFDAFVLLNCSADTGPTPFEWGWGEHWTSPATQPRRATSHRFRLVSCVVLRARETA